MKRSSTLFLRIVVILVGIPVLPVCILWLPGLVAFMTSLHPFFTYLYYPMLIGIYITAGAYYFALYQAFQLLNHIDQNTAFSELTVTTLRNIKFSALTISAIYTLCMPIIFNAGDKDDAPGLVLIGFVFIFVSLVIAVFSAVLQALLKEAIEIKTENELTI